MQTVPPVLSASLDRIAAEAAAAGGEMAIVVRHLERGEAYARDGDCPYVAASTIKVPILVALYDAAARGVLRLDEPVRLVPEDQVTGSGVCQFLSPGVRLPLRDLAELMIVVSDNTATNLVLRRIGIDAVNACLQRLGLRTTRVRRPLQVIPAGEAEPNSVTAGELADLLTMIARARAVSWDACRRMVATLKRQQADEALPALLPDPQDLGGGAVGAFPRWEMAHKTGAVPGRCHDVGLLYLPGQTIVLSVLTRRCGPLRAARARIARVGRAVWEAYRPAHAGGRAAAPAPPVGRDVP